MANRKVDVPTYQAFGLFVERCLRNDQSMLWPQQTVWTLDSLNELKARTIDAPLLEANRPFEDKLREQLSGADPRLWQIIADTYYVYFLPSSYISFKKKVNDIRWAARQAGAEVPPEESEIWTALNLGYTTTSLKYHSKYSQFWLINLLAIHVKQSKDPELILADPGQMQTALDAILEGITNKPDRASDMRHALLYMAFPEDYERSISTRDKVRIVEHYGEDVPDLAADVDQGLKQVREHLGAARPELGGAFDFYSDLKDEWRPVEQPKKGTSGAPSAERGELIGLGAGFDPSKDDLFQEAMLTLGQTRNLILYGPPGTGKTFYAAKLAERLARGGSGDKLSQAARLQAIAEPLTFHEILALAIAHEDSNGKFSVSELESLPIVDARFKMSPVKHPKNQIWGYLQTHTSPESLTVQISRRAEPFLFDKDAESRWFLTQGGNEYVNEFSIQ